MSNASPQNARCLAERLCEWPYDYLRFRYDLSLPFTNNLSEQAIRMFKVKSKISSGFRTTTGADWLCCIRSCIATCQRQGMVVLDCLGSVFAGQVATPKLTAA